MTSDLATFSKELAAVLPTLGSDRFVSVFVGMLKQLVTIDNAVIVAYPTGSLPVVEYNDLPPQDRPSNIDIFLKGAYLLDPYYKAVKEGRTGFFRLSELAPEGFTQSEYYRHYYRYTGMIDECGYLIKTGDNRALNISLGRVSFSQRFNRAELALLQDITPVVEALMCIQGDRGDLSATPATGSLNMQLDTALSNFGTSLLTERESQVVQLFLHGHSTKSIAERLGISPETVKLHRKNSYAKLDVSSQAELFFLFIDSLSSLDEYTGGDPLIGYLTHVK